MTETWDVFCRVVDNFGDAAVSWRLCRQLAMERGLPVRLWIDDLATLKRMVNAVDGTCAVQRVDQVEIHRWSAPFTALAPGAVILEMFGCDLPPAVIEAMVARRPAPVWINVEYLSAESWVAGSHGLPSPHPRLPLTRHFFFPGFDQRTGGLLRERDLLARRDAFVADVAARSAFWSRLKLPAPSPGDFLVSVFAYENATLPPLLKHWSTATRSIHALIPEETPAARLVDESSGGIGPASIHRGALTLSTIPFLEQADYDLLLWSCDFNFVRGEDSFVRAQWAGQPFAWHIYPQADDAHWPKLDAFLARYSQTLGNEARARVQALWRAWNGEGDSVRTWDTLVANYAEIRAGAKAWSCTLAAEPSFVDRLVEFIQKRI